MGRKSKYIKSLTEEQKSSLRKGYTHGKSPVFRRKCQSILLSYEGKTTQQLADFFQVSGQTVRRWFHEWESQGLEGLDLKKGRGRKRKLDPNDSEQVEIIKTFVTNEPRNLNKITTQIEEALGISVSKKSLKRFLKNLNTDGNDLESD